MFKRFMEPLMHLFSGMQSFIKKDVFPPPGLHHYLREAPVERTRDHLREDPDGHGTLMINANQVVHLNPTATLMAFLFLEKKKRKSRLCA
jgi:hypothetical protein